MKTNKNDAYVNEELSKINQERLAQQEIDQDNLQQKLDQENQEQKKLQQDNNFFDEMYNDGATVNEELSKINQERLAQQKNDQRLMDQIEVNIARNSRAWAITGLVFLFIGIGAIVITFIGFLFSDIGTIKAILKNLYIVIGLSVFEIALMLLGIGLICYSIHLNHSI